MQTLFTHAMPALQGMLHPPQLAVSVAKFDSQPFAGSASQLPKPAEHVNPQASAAQVAVAFAGTGHTAQVGPHARRSVFAAQVPATVQAWKRGLHVKVQTLAAQAVVPFSTAGHLMLQPPQWFSLVFESTQSAPHLSGATGVQPSVHWKDAPAGAQSGAAAPQIALHDPQLVALERSVSQPSAAFALQSA